MSLSLIRAVGGPQKEGEWDDYEGASAAPVCESCSGTEFIEDARSGDSICSNCGEVYKEKLVSEDAEYRVFSEDSASYSKIRVGAAYNIFQEHSLTEKSMIDRDEKEFLWDGLKNIDEVLNRLYNGDSSNIPVRERARELFQKAFRKQVKQKQGAVPMKRSGKKGKDDKKDGNRLKFSRRKQFVVTCLFLALREQNIKKWNLSDLSDQLDGIDVSDYSMRNCLRELGMETEGDRLLGSEKTIE